MKLIKIDTEGSRMQELKEKSRVQFIITITNYFLIFTYPIGQGSSRFYLPEMSQFIVLLARNEILLAPGILVLV